MLKFFYIFFLLIVINSSGLFAQIHYSNFDNASIQLNPSLIGKFSGDYRFSGINRNQWKNITTPFSYNYLSFDMNLFRHFDPSKYNDSLHNKEGIRKQYFSLGIVYNNSKAGDSKFGKESIGASLAFHKKLNYTETKILSFGVLINNVSTKISYDNLYFDNQYNGIRFNETLPNNEVLINKNASYLDVSVGASYKNTSNRLVYDVGISAYHLNSPKLLSINNVSLYKTFSSHIITEYKINNSHEINPKMFFVYNESYLSFTSGFTYKYNIGISKEKDKVYNSGSINIGGYYRLNDAVILLLGYTHKNWNFAFNYDMTISNLKGVNNGFGAYELSLCYIIDRKIDYQQKALDKQNKKEQRLEEEFEKQAEQQKKEEQKAEEQRIEEEQEQEELQQKAEEKRIAEEQKQEELQQRAEEQRIAEEQKQEEIQQKAEQKLEEQKIAEEQKQEEMQQKEQELKIKEEQKQAEQKQKAEQKAEQKLEKDVKPNKKPKKKKTFNRKVGTNPVYL